MNRFTFSMDFFSSPSDSFLSILGLVDNALECNPFSGKESDISATSANFLTASNTFSGWVYVWRVSGEEGGKVVIVRNEEGLSTR